MGEQSVVLHNVEEKVTLYRELDAVNLCASMMRHDIETLLVLLFLRVGNTSASS